MRGLLLFPFLFVFNNAFTQFSSEIIISSQENSPRGVYAVDLDGDGDFDVLAGSEFGPNLTWFENLGNGNFSQQIIIPTPIDFIWNVYAADLDGDGDFDILPAHNNNVSWYENLGNSSFSEQKIIEKQGLRRIVASDLNGDARIDILFASHFQDNKIAWYENMGNGSFSEQKIISLDTPFPSSVRSADLDNDGDLDIASSAQGYGNDGEIAWHENLGNGNFSNKKVISTQVLPYNDIHIADLDGDNFKDIIYIARDNVSWYKNKGDGSFSSDMVISSNAQFAQSVQAADLDGDEDLDVITASFSDDKIAWYENLGNGNFSAQKIISTQADRARSVFIADLDADGSLDVLSASSRDNKIAWYKNLFGTTSSFDNQLKKTSIEVYPNPFDKFFFARINNQTLDSVLLSLFDSSGQLVQSVTLNGTNMQISTAHLANGLYFYKVNNADGQMIGNGKVIKH